MHWLAYTQLSRFSTPDHLQNLFPQKMYPRKSNQEVSLDLFSATLFHASVVLVLDVGCAANWLQMP